MITEAEALKRIVSVALPSDRQKRLPLAESVGQVAAESVRCQIPMPRFRSTSVDGYALCEGAHPSGAEFRLAGEQAAGVDQNLKVRPGETIRVFTGAPLPQGTTTIVMQEDVCAEGSNITLTDAALPDRYLREAGEDLCEGQRLISVGDRLTIQSVSLLASQGLETIAVREGPRVTVVSTGDELVPPGNPLEPGQIYESNGLMLRLLAAEAGASKVTVRHVPDDPDVMRDTLASLLETHDFLLLSGGVSVGDHDHVRPVLDGLGMETHFWKVRVKPGKPLLFGQCGDCLVFGLPGNPASSYVSFQVFVAAALRRWFGAQDDQASRPFLPATLSGRTLINDSDRPHYVRGRWEAAEASFQALGLQQSHALQSLALANALARLPAEATLAEGDAVEVLLLG